MDTTALPTTLVDAIRYFADPDVCREFVAAMRWPNGVMCPRDGCGSTAVHFIVSRGIWRCNGCKKQFSVKVGTIFEDSPISLDKWLPAVWMVTASKKGVSSYQMARSLGVTQKTAWFMDHRIRFAMKIESFDNPLSGTVEADETWVGGKEKNKHEGKKSHRGPLADKALVMGMLERNGQVRAMVVHSTRRSELERQIFANVAPGSIVYTDALKSYRALRATYQHDFIDHAAEYVRGRVHTNGIENFWSLFKRMIIGTYHQVSDDHLDRYVDEESFRFNTRDQGDGERFANTTRRISGKRLTYAALTDKTV